MKEGLDSAPSCSFSIERESSSRIAFITRSSSARAEPAPSKGTAVRRTSRRLCRRPERLEWLACGIGFLVKTLPSRLRTRLEWRRQDRRALLRLLFFLDLHLRNQNARGSRRDRNKA